MLVILLPSGQFFANCFHLAQQVPYPPSARSNVLPCQTMQTQPIKHFIVFFRFSLKINLNKYWFLFICYQILHLRILFFRRRGVNSKLYYDSQSSNTHIVEIKMQPITAISATVLSYKQVCNHTQWLSWW